MLLVKITCHQVCKCSFSLSSATARLFKCTKVSSEHAGTSIALENVTKKWIFESQRNCMFESQGNCDFF